MRKILLAGLIGCVWQAREAHASCAAPANPIEAENCLPGTSKSVWDISPASGNPTIEGFATDISYNRGETVSFKIRTDAPDYRLDIYRLGYYGGQGARLVAQVSPDSFPAQPDCLTDAATGLIDCGNWSVTATWPIPNDAVSGVYVAKVIRLDDNGASHVVFIVRNDGGSENILFQTSDPTWQAYNPWGGNSLYIGAPSGTGGYKVSYNRPLIVRTNYPTSVFHQEYPVIRWLESNGYDVAYFAGVDTDRHGGRLLDHKVFMSVGHDEYWSPNQRASVEAARAAGVHLALFSATTSLWKTRWESSADGSSTPMRTLACYKESIRGPIDPQPDWTGLWRDTRGSDAGRHENALTGHGFGVDALRNDSMAVPAEFGRLRFWRDTSVASLSPGQTAIFPQTVGFEWDTDKINDSRPPGLIRMSSSTIEVSKHLDYALYETTVPVTHRLVFYKHSSGSLVFGAGTMQWGWGLDEVHNGGTGAPVQPAMRQATVNLLADMGVQPVSLQPGLVAASASNDSTPPTAVIIPAAGAAVGATQVLTGVASDAGGGVVGGVEVSTNDGVIWRPAEGTENWRYSWTVTGNSTVRVRAADDSGNLSAPSTALTIMPGAPAPAGPSIGALSPSTAPVGGTSFLLIITGSGFLNGAVVQWDGVDKPTTYLGSGMLRASISAADLAAAGPRRVTVMNPGGELSPLAADFTVVGISPLQLDQAKVFPNPWRADRHGGLPVTFGSLPAASTVKLFTVSGRHVRTIQGAGGATTWDLRTDDGESAASGYYLYLISDGNGGRRRGTLALIR